MLLTHALGIFALLSSAVAIAVPAAEPEPEPEPVEVVVEGQTMVDFENIQCETVIDIETTSGKSHGLKPICPMLNGTMEHGCVRYVMGFDVTGVVSEVDLTYPEIQDACDCIQACLDRPTTCAAYVWKFSTPDSVTAGYRTCTLYSQFNLPSEVAIVIDIANSTNMNINGDEIMQNNNNPQMGSMVSQTFMDANLNTTVDKKAVSGEVWQLSTGMAIC